MYKVTTDSINAIRAEIRKISALHKSYAELMPLNISKGLNTELQTELDNSFMALIMEILKYNTAGDDDVIIEAGIRLHTNVIHNIDLSSVTYVLRESGIEYSTQSIDGVVVVAI